MQVGDLVELWCDGRSDDAAAKTGLILEIINWVDQGAPDRNFGTDIKVLWSDGQSMLYGPEEIRVVNESRKSSKIQQ